MDSQINDALHPVIYDALSGSLGGAFARAEIRAGEDSLGDPALFIKAFLRPRAKRPSSKSSLDAMVAIRERLLAVGEDRQPYLDLEYPTDSDGIPV